MHTLADMPVPVVRDPALEPIAAKVHAGERLTIEEGETLFVTPDIWTVCSLADQVRRRLHGEVAYYNINRHLNYTNICALSCKFCEFRRSRGEAGAYEHSLDEVRAEARKAIAAGATEMHIVGGLHPYLPFEYYTDMVSTIREEAEAALHCGAGFQPASDPNPAQAERSGNKDMQAGSLHHNLETDRLHIKAFTAVEIVHFAKIAKVYKQADPEPGIRWVLERLKEAGLGSLPGGGAEVFDDRVHDEAFKGKIRSDVWLVVHRIAHELGLNTNATMLYGHIETPRDRLVHMDMLRCAQDEALTRLGYEADTDGCVTLTREEIEPPTPVLNTRGGYFQTITPLPFFPDGSELEHLPGPGGLENLRTLAVSRLMLDNFPHVKAFWIMQTLGMAQLMLQNGADDIDGTVMWYDITKLPQGAGEETAGATHQETTVTDLTRAIREAGFEPVERDTLYRKVEREGERWWVAAD
ncbi:Aminodeoxyfutalosine synthase [hydrothermal vent metagenome]|uniref:Aminodeoxyfutalosine synthase n=1 Tax=hydrothermal vent metagenome TaxID=652676 RepID=A0A3B1DEB4_9ZZZZ